MLYTIIYREELRGEFYVEADSVDNAMKAWYDDIDDGKIDFSDMEMVNSYAHAVLCEDEVANEVGMGK